MKLQNKMQCGACDSTEIAVECLVIQGPDGLLEVTCLMDEGHLCNECGSENIEVAPTPPTLREIYQQQIDFVNASKVTVETVPIYGHVTIADADGNDIFLQGHEGSDFITRARRLWETTGYLTQSEANEVIAYEYLDALSPV